MADEKRKKQPTQAQYEVCWNKDTEPPLSSEYPECNDKSICRCVCSGSNLFSSSDTKFDSGTCWLSFYEPINADHIKEGIDSSYGIVRTEVVCANCSTHLGHMFDYKPNPTGSSHYCINSLSLKLAKGARNE